MAMAGAGGDGLRDVSVIISIGNTVPAAPPTAILCCSAPAAIPTTASTTDPIDRPGFLSFDDELAL